MAGPIMRVGADWDGDGFICWDVAPTDSLNILHSGRSDSDPSFVNLRWGNVPRQTYNSATSVNITALSTDYGARVFQCVTGTNVSAGAYFGYPSGTYGYFNIPTGGTVRLTFWHRLIVGTSMGMTVDVCHGTGTVAGTSTFTANTSWQKKTLTFTRSQATGCFRFYKTNSASNVTFQITGIMLTASGSGSPVGFNAGNTSNYYDDITSDVQSMDWKLSSLNMDSCRLEEGACSLTLDNSSRRFSPEYSSGPLYGSLLNRRAVAIETQHPSTSAWTRLWVGYTSKYSPSPGKTRNQQAVIEAAQGVFALDEMTYSSPLRVTSTHLTSGVRSSDLILSALTNGFATPANATQFVIGRDKFDGGTLMSPSSMYDVSAGYTTFDAKSYTLGDAFALDFSKRDQTPTAKTVIERVMESERGFAWIGRDGRFVSRGRYYYSASTAPSPTSISLDTMAQGSNYAYGDNYANVVALSYSPTGDENNIEVVWQNYTPLKLLGGRSRVMFIDPKREDGSSVPVSQIMPFGTEASNSTVTLVGSYPQWVRVGADVSLEGSRARVTVTNGTKVGALVNVVLRGRTRSGKLSTETITAKPPSGLDSSKIEKRISNRLFNNMDDATNLAYFVLNKHNQNLGEVKTVTMISKDNTALARMLDNTLGSFWSVTEYQTAQSAQRYIVTGESGKWQPGILSITYNLYHLSRVGPAPWILGTSVTGTSTYLGY